MKLRWGLLFFVLVNLELWAERSEGHKGNFFQRIFRREGGEAKEDLALAKGADPGWNASLSKFVRSRIPKSFLTLPPAVVGKVCPRFAYLNAGQRLDFFENFFRALSKTESDHNPQERYNERGAGFKTQGRMIRRATRRRKAQYATTYKKDAVTGQPIVSEGMTQVSYQDSQKHGCPFDWNRDRKLASNHPSKTIFDPYKNLQCAINIMENQIKNRKTLITNNQKYYFAVLETSRPRHKVFMQEARKYKPCFEASGK